MTDPRVREELDAPLKEQFGMSLGAVEEELYQAMAVGGAILPRSIERYRELAERRRQHEDVAAEALDAAGDLAAVLQVARRHQSALAVLNATELKTAQLFGTLDQVYDSLVLLTDPDTADAGLGDDDLEALLAMPALQEWLAPRL